MAYRPSWKGHLKVSLVSCPVTLYNATTQARMVSFHLLNPETMNRIQMRPYDPDTGEVERQTLVHGYEVEKGHYVTVEEDELKNIRLPSTKTIDIEKFVDRDAIDPVYIDGLYYLAPDKGGEDAFAVIREAMRAHRKAALGRLVMSHRERTVAITPRGSGMLVEMLRHPQEIRSDKEIFDAIPSAKPDKGMVDIAARIIDQSSGKFEPKDFEDRYESALRELVDARARGKTVAVPEPPRDTKVVDLMAVLKASLGRRGPPPAGGGTVIRLPTRGAKRQRPRRTAKPRRARG
ncbi:MAG: Ku protein [Alphaproteobacteria bacterium]|nr:Ku protein [Alphaproteobacteria bacterium]